VRQVLHGPHRKRVVLILCVGKGEEKW
jgi:hypothetical protein